MKNSSKKKLYKYKYSGVTRRAMPMGPHHSGVDGYRPGKVHTYLGLSCMCSKQVHTKVYVLHYSDVTICEVMGVSRFPGDPLVPQVNEIARLDCSYEETVLWCDARGFKQCRKSTLSWIKWWLLFKQALHVDMVEAFKWLWKS